jgi:HEPN domain-containing protein
VDNKEKFEHWKEFASYDLESAKAMLMSGRYLYVVFMCQQAIEKIVKGIYVLYKGEEAPRTHNIWLVFKELVQSVDFQKSVAEVVYREKLIKYKSFFADLMFYYISERYPSYKQKISGIVDETKASEVLTMTEEVFLWVQSLSQYWK